MRHIMSSKTWRTISEDKEEKTHMEEAKKEVNIVKSNN